MNCRLSLGLCLWVWFGCSGGGGDRLEFEQNRRSQILDESTSLDVVGGTFVKVQSTVSPTNDRQTTKFTLRAESLNPMIRIQTSDCLPQVFHFEVLNTDTQTCVYEAFRLGEHATDEGTRRLLDSLVDVPTPGRDTPGTYTVRSNECSYELDEGGTVQLSVCIDWNTGRSSVLPGLVQFETCFPNVSRGTCVQDVNGLETAVSSQTLETVITLSQKMQTSTVVAAVSNLPNRAEDLAALGQSLLSQGADFLMIVGDITSDGTIAEAESVKTLLDTHVPMPWFATLGDKDVGGNLGLEYLGLFGASSLAFEVLGVRFVMLDSAARALKESEALLDIWLSDMDLDGSSTSAIKHLVFTHFPPFNDDVGPVHQFAHVLEAGDLVARLTAIDALGLVVGESQQAGVDTLASLDIFRVGSTQNVNRLIWTKFQIDADCIKACHTSTDACHCLSHELITIQR